MAERNVLNEIEVEGYKFPSGFAKYVSKNTFEPQAEIEKMCNGEYDVKGVDVIYRPTLDITFSNADIENFRIFIKKVNQRSFDCKYYDYELNKTVTRKMRMKTFDVNKLYAQMNNLMGMSGITVSFECIYGYLNYDDLENGVHQ